MDYKDKIRKLLALAKSPEPEEAKLALLKARKLMAEHKLSERDLEERNTTVIKRAIGEKFSKKANSWIQELRHQTDDLLQCAAPVGEARDRPECYRLHLLRMRPSRGPRKGSRGHSQRGAGADYGHHQQALRLRRTEMARNSVCKTAILFVFGGLVYFGLEVLFRGHSHWTMFVLGGFLFLILGELNEGLLEWDTPLIWQGVLGSALVTGAELVTGMILIVWLGRGVWDYSGMPFNYKGQICLPFSILWIFVSIAAVVLDDWLRYWLFGEEHPHYTLFRRGESR